MPLLTYSLPIRFANSVLSVKPNTPNPVTWTRFNNEFVASIEKNFFQLWVLTKFQIVSLLNNRVTKAVPFGLVERSVSKS
jgi:hypothetical protein